MIKILIYEYHISFQLYNLPDLVYWAFFHFYYFRYLVKIVHLEQLSEIIIIGLQNQKIFLTYLPYLFSLPPT